MILIQSINLRVVIRKIVALQEIWPTHIFAHVIRVSDYKFSCISCAYNILYNRLIFPSNIQREIYLDPFRRQISSCIPLNCSIIIWYFLMKNFRSITNFHVISQIIKDETTNYQIWDELKVAMCSKMKFKHKLFNFKECFYHDHWIEWHNLV